MFHLLISAQGSPESPLVDGAEVSVSKDSNNPFAPPSPATYLAIFKIPLSSILYYTFAWRL